MVETIEAIEALILLNGQVTRAIGSPVCPSQGPRGDTCEVDMHQARRVQTREGKKRARVQ
jgi:hypothetical protein